jgi:hypothetical protein
MLLQGLLETFLRRDRIDGGREEADAHGKSAVALESESGRTQQKIARNLRHEADAIAAFAIGGDSATMGEAAQGSQRMAQHLVRRLIGNTRDEAYATGIVVKARVYERTLG